MTTAGATKNKSYTTPTSSEQLFYSKKSLVPEWQQILIEKKFTEIQKEIGVLGETTSMWSMFIANRLSVLLIHMTDGTKAIKVIFNKKLDKYRY